MYWTAFLAPHRIAKQAIEEAARLRRAGDLSGALAVFDSLPGKLQERYGYAQRDRPVEVVAVRTAEIRPGPAISLPAGEKLRAAGPAVVELEGATCWIPPGWVGDRDGNSTLVVTRA